MHECIRNPKNRVGSTGTREQAELEVRSMADDNLRAIWHRHLQPDWRASTIGSDRYGVNGKVLHPNLRRFVRLVAQEAHRRGFE